MARIIALANQKGGVPKTSSAINLGAALLCQGRRVLLIDLDPQASLTAALGIIQQIYRRRSMRCSCTKWRCPTSLLPRPVSKLRRRRLISQIMPNPRQPHTIFDQTKLEELGDSIREHGIIQPVIVRPTPLTKWEGHARRYELIAGERRWRASALAERGTIPALIRQDTSDHGSLIELALIENWVFGNSCG